MKPNFGRAIYISAVLQLCFFGAACSRTSKKIKSHSTFIEQTRYLEEAKRIAEKCQNLPAPWIQARIGRELEPFRLNQISLKALDITYEQFIKIAARGTRYRFINGEIFRKGPDPFGMDFFFRNLAHYAEYPGVPHLPNVDLIWNHDDATPLEFQPRDFWITKKMEDQAPIFTYAVKKGCPYLVSIPDRFTIPSWPDLSTSILKANQSSTWSSKHKKAFWRGQCNDFARLGPGPIDFSSALNKYSQLARYQICYLSSQFPASIDAGFNGYGFANNAILEEIARPFFKMGVFPVEHLEFAYLPVLDGFTSTYPGYLWRLLSNCVAFKQESEDSQWFYDALEPYVHYVPIQNRMEDLIEKINWAKENDSHCQLIAKNSTEFVLNNLMIEDIYAYFFRLFDEYEGCLSFDTSDLLEITKSDHDWVKITP